MDDFLGYLSYAFGRNIFASHGKMAKFDKNDPKMCYEFLKNGPQIGIFFPAKLINVSTVPNKSVQGVFFLEINR